ncbi:MAG: MetQ/NlpA family ABC transporter substrate-binding protein, partial [Bacilli bacterium]
MKKFTGVLLTAALAFGLAACGNGEKEVETIKVGASNVPHAEILEQAKPLLEEKGYKLEIEVFTDYVLPNKFLASEDLDANYFQHIPYLEAQMKENKDYKFVNVGGVHIEPIGIYTKKYKDINDLPNGATIIMSNSVADHGRILGLLQTQGLIKLDSSVDTTIAQVKDIVENPKNLKFKTDVDAGVLPSLYKNEEGDAVVINGNYALDAGLNPLTDALVLEGADSPYVNVLVAREDNKDDAGIKALAEI